MANGALCADAGPTRTSEARSIAAPAPHLRRRIERRRVVASGATRREVPLASQEKHTGTRSGISCFSLFPAGEQLPQESVRPVIATAEPEGQGTVHTRESCYIQPLKRFKLYPRSLLTFADGAKYHASFDNS